MRRGVGAHRVSAHFQVAPVQPRRDDPGYGQVFEVHLGSHRRMDPDQERALAAPPAPAIGRGDHFDPTLGHSPENVQSPSFPAGLAESSFARRT